MHPTKAAILLSFGLSAQQLIPPGSDQERLAVEMFDRSAAAPDLKCKVRTYDPRLSFSFRYWSGYEVTIPVRGLAADPGSELQILLRAAPLGGKPRFLYQRRPLPALPEDPRERKRAELFVSGGLAMGVGEYRLSLQISDASGRVCRSQWKAVAPGSKVPLRMEPGEIADSWADKWKGFPEKNSAGRVTIFLHAAPIFARRNLTRLSPWDTAVLLGSLASLLDTLPFRQARVVAYNLDNREVLFHDPNFGPDGLEKLGERLEAINLGLISADTLRRTSPSGLLSEIVDAELESSEKADAIVFLGPLSRYFKKAPPEWKRYRGKIPEPYGVAVFPRFSQTGDIIQTLVKAAGGDTVMVYQPSDLAKAAREISKAEAN
jgi:hypothetical protein